FTEFAKVGDEFRIDPKQRDFIPFANTSVHSPLPYIAQGFGINVVRIFTSSALAISYGGRFGNLLATLGLFFLPTRTTPIFKWTFVLLALTPMSLFLMASMSADAFTNGISFLFIASVFRLAFGLPEPPTRRALVNLFLAAVGVGLAKQMYYPLVLLF